MLVCPKCGMEYVDGITTCTECKVPLLSKEEFQQATRIAIVKADERLAARITEYLIYCHMDNASYEYDEADETYVVYVDEADADEALKQAKLLISQEGDQYTDQSDEDEIADNEEDTTGFDSAATCNTNMEWADNDPENENSKAAKPSSSSKVSKPSLVIPEADVEDSVYVTKKSSYEEFHSSGVSFVIVGIVAIIFDVMVLTGLVRLPVAPTSNLMLEILLAIIGVAFILISVHSFKKAATLKVEADEEEQLSESWIDTFVKQYSAEDFDNRISSMAGGDGAPLDEALMSFQRLDLIKEQLKADHREIAEHLKDSYLDALCDQIYTKLYEE